MFKNTQRVGLVVLAFLVSGLVLHMAFPLAQAAGDEPVVLAKPAEMTEAFAEKRVANTDYVSLTTDEARKLQKSGAIDGVTLPQQYHQAVTVNDTYELQGYLAQLDAESSWDIATGDSNTVVAVIDSGFALGHEDLSGRWFTNSGESGATASEGGAPNCTSRSLPLDKSCNNLDDDSNGFVDDWRGWDFANDDNDVSAGTTNTGGDAVSHATAVSGMIGATGNNAIGVASLNWAATLLPIEIFDDDGNATTVEVAEGLAYAIDMGADVINMSLGSTATDPVIEDLLDDAEAAGIVVVASAGNCGGSSYALNGCDYEDQMLYPATNLLTIAVAGVDGSDVQASFSSEGSQVDITAPATGAIRTTLYSSSDPNGAYSASISGTSFSAPIVAGAAALIKDVWPTASPREVRAVLVDSALRVSGMSGQLFTNRYGFGRLRPATALDLAERCATATTGADINCDDSVDLLDLSVLANQWNTSRTGRSDINTSGATDLLDLSLLASNWGS